MPAESGPVMDEQEGISHNDSSKPIQVKEEELALSQNGKLPGKNADGSDMLGNDLIPNGDKHPKDSSVAEAQSKKLRYPKQVFFIMGNECCERFSYYGMRTVLTLYLNRVLNYNEDDSTVIYHAFILLCYFFPLIGGIIADSWLGKFRTIAYISIIYALGNIVLSLSAVTTWNIPSREIAFIGLILIAMGTGGIKPCVSSFGGDQFVVPQQERQLVAFFSIFYFFINLGSLVSTFLTPELSAIPCLGYDTCYPLAFGVPAALMIISLVLFVAGKPIYIMKDPEGNLFLLVSKCTWSAITNKFRRKKGEPVKEHWLDYADDRFSEKLRYDIRLTLRVLLLFVPLPVFWALYDQQGTRWTFQANNMTGRVGSWIMKPEQLQLVNPLLILAMLPIMEAWVYPALARCRLLHRPLQKMAAGGLLAAVAFVISGVVELQLEAGPGFIVEPTAGQAQIHLLSGLPCNVTLSGQDLDGGSFALASLGSWDNMDLKASGTKSLSFHVSGDCAEGDIAFDAREAQSHSYHLYVENKVPKVLGPYKDILTKDAKPTIRVMHRFANSDEHHISFAVNGKTISVPVQGNKAEVLDSGDYVVEADRYIVSLDGTQFADVDLDIGGIYTILIDDTRGVVKTFVLPNTVSMFWLLPQYIVVTLGEVLLSVTGLEFSFTQAPLSMKSFVSSVYQLTDAFGNVIIILIAEAKILPTQSGEFFLFAGVMTAAMGVFIWLSMRFKYTDVSGDQGLGAIDTIKSSDNRNKEKLSSTGF